MMAREASKAMLCCTSLPPACPKLDQALAVACTPCRVGGNAVRLAPTFLLCQVMPPY